MACFNLSKTYPFLKLNLYNDTQLVLYFSQKMKFMSHLFIFQHFHACGAHMNGYLIDHDYEAHHQWSLH